MISFFGSDSQGYTVLFNYYVKSRIFSSRDPA